MRCACRPPCQTAQLYRLHPARRGRRSAGQVSNELLFRQTRQAPFLISDQSTIP